MRPLLVGGMQGQRERARARSRCEHGLGDVVRDQVADQRLRVLGCGHAQHRLHVGEARCQRASVSRIGGDGVVRSVVEHLSADRKEAVDRHERRCDDIAVEQRGGGEAAGVRELGQRSGEGETGGEADRGLDGAGHHDRQSDLLGDAQAGVHATERCDLEHRDVGGLELDDTHRVGGATDRLVGGDRHADLAAHRGEVLDAGAGLLDVLEPVRSDVECRDRADGLVDGPAAVGVDAHVAARTERVAYGLDPFDVVGEGLAASRRP